MPVRRCRSLGPLLPPVDLIVLEDGEHSDYFARNAEGVHVPLATMDTFQRAAAWRNRKKYEEKQ